MFFTNKIIRKLKKENEDNKKTIKKLQFDVATKNQIIDDHKKTFAEIMFQLERNDYNNCEQKLNKIKELVSDLNGIN